MYKDKEKQKRYMAEYFQKHKSRINEYRKNYDKNVTRKYKKNLGVYIEKDLIEKFENKLVKDNLTKTDFVKQKILEYLKED